MRFFHALSKIGKLPNSDPSDRNFAMIYLPSGVPGRRLEMRKFNYITHMDMATARFLAKGQQSVLSDEDRASVFMHENQPFHLLAVCSTFPPDLSWQLALEMNDAEAAACVLCEDPLGALIDVFSPVLAIGVEAVRQKETLSVWQRHLTTINPIAQSVQRVEKMMEVLADRQESALQKVATEMREGLAASSRETYAQVAEKAKTIPVPFPSSSIKDVEDFLSASERYDAARVIFKELDKVKLKCQQVSNAHRRNETMRFPAKLIVDYVFTEQALVELANGGWPVGKHTMNFMISRANYIMGPSWNGTEVEMQTKFWRYIVGRNGGDEGTPSKKRRK